MAASRPGNPDRGWNDPPMFMYNKDGQRLQPSSRKNPLTQRVGMQQSCGHAIPTTGVLNPGPPDKALPGAPPKLPMFSSPPTIDSVTSPVMSSEVKVEGGEDSSILLANICDTTMTKLRDVLKQCKGKLKTRVADDIKKKMDVLHASWTTDKLSAVVQQRMAKLSTALAEREYDRAHDVHLSLMVDYVSEVSQWMVGIKRLIMEARTILPPPPPPSETTEEADEQPSSSNEVTAEGSDQSAEVSPPMPFHPSSSAVDADSEQKPSNGAFRDDAVSKGEQHSEHTAAEGLTSATDVSDSQPSISESPPSEGSHEDVTNYSSTREQSQNETGECLKERSVTPEQTVQSEGKNGINSDSNQVTDSEPKLTDTGVDNTIKAESH